MACRTVVLATMTFDPRDPGGPPGNTPQRLVVTSPSGVPAAAWTMRLDHEPIARTVVVARMTLRLEGDRWVRAPHQDPLPTEPGSLPTSPPATSTPLTQATLARASDVPRLGAVTHDATLILEPSLTAAARRVTRLGGGLPTLLVAGGSTQRLPLTLVPIRLGPALATLVLDMWTSFPAPAMGVARLVLAIDDDAAVEREEETLTTAGRAAGTALPFQSGAVQEEETSPAPPSPRSAAAGLPFNDGATVGRAPSAAPGQKQTLFLAQQPIEALLATPETASPTAMTAMPPVTPPAFVAPPAPIGAPHAPAQPAPPAASPFRSAPPLSTALPATPSYLVGTAAEATRGLRPATAPAAPNGVVDASNRASDPRPPDLRGVTDRDASAAQEAVDLVCFDPEVGPRLRGRPAWKRLLREAPSRAPDPRDVAEETTVDAEARSAAVEIILSGTPDPLGSWAEMLVRAAAPRGRFLPPLALGVARLRFDFDERAVLRAHCAAAKAHAGDTALAEAIARGTALAADADPMIPLVDFQEALAQLRLAFAAKERAISVATLQQRAEQTLVAQRAWKLVELRGTERVRGRLEGDLASPGALVTTYLSHDGARRLPIARSWSVRVVAELRGPEEVGHEGAELAASVLALGLPLARFAEAT